jgi:hypothetical protein
MLRAIGVDPRFCGDNTFLIECKRDLDRLDLYIDQTLLIVRRP